MATKIILKKSSTGGSAPLTSDLDQSELAINLADRKIYTKNNSGAIVTLNGAYVDSVAPANPAEGDLWYDTANNILKSYNGSSFASAGYTNISDLEDVTLTAITSGEILKWNGSAWINNTLAEAGIQPSGSYAAASHTHTLSNITDVTATAAEVNLLDGVTASTTEINYVDGVTSNIQTQLNGKASTSHNHTLDGLSNTTITSNSAGEILKWSGTAWINNTLAEAGIAAASHNHSGVYEPADATILKDADIGVTVQGYSAVLDATTASFTTADETKLDGIAASATNTKAPAIYDAAGTPTLETGITAAEVRTAIGAGTSNFDGAYSSLSGIPSTFTPSAHTLDSHSNVTITSNSAGEILKWNGTAWVNNTLAEAGIQPSGSYLTSESDTLSTVTGRGSSTASAISITNATASSSTSTGALVVTGGVGVGTNLNVGGNAVITGNLTVNGTTTTVNSNTVNIGDNIIVLNADETGVPSQNGGIEIERGTSANVSFQWVEASDYWSLGNETLGDVIIDGGSY